uniref:THAP domain-containing protein 2 n=1 Tax=Lygus hesperus TaxID=30085 RepID=A0A0A9Y1L2_LYGHE
MVCCAVAGCSTHGRHQSNGNYRFHRFPSDEKVRSKWINACKRADRFCVNNSRVCSFHFDQSDYARDLKSELLNIPSKFILRTDAVPHLRLHFDTFLSELELSLG